MTSLSQHVGILANDRFIGHCKIESHRSAVAHGVLDELEQAVKGLQRAAKHSSERGAQ